MAQETHRASQTSSIVSSWTVEHTLIYEDSLDHLTMYASIQVDDSFYGDYSQAVAAMPQWHHLGMLQLHLLEALPRPHHLEQRHHLWFQRTLRRLPLLPRNLHLLIIWRPMSRSRQLWIPLQMSL